ncbi:hypothetical protein [Streptomyces sp. NPDC059783]|uniref:hypothetical protein n=1 Tax=Streptomyces sp. NPDC059783 TaxID=3346944 RepID=UPI00365D48C6
MSASTASASVPEPNSTPSGADETNPQNSVGRGLFASMVAPVEPARTTFNLTPTTASGDTPTDGAAAVDGGPSSATFHDETSPASSSGAAASGASGKAQVGILRAWLIAGATRWGRGGGTANKRLDMHKARAQAQQVKETRQVTINRTPAPPTGGRGPGAPGPTGGKGLSQKAPTGNSTKGTKDTGPSGKGSRRGPAGRSNTGSAGPAGRGAGDGNRGAAGTANTNSPKPLKTPKATTEKPGKTPTPASQASGTPGSKGAPGAAGKDGSTPKAPAPAKDKTGTTGIKASDAAPKAKKPGKENATPGPAANKASSTKKANDKTADPKTTAPGAKPTTTPTGPAGKQPFSTRNSRETGYRDGARAAQAAAHAKAYRDGVKDGWAHTMATADRERTALDQARDDRTKARQETPVTTTPLATSTDHHTGPQPIPVNGIDATHLHLGEGATRNRISRGEVRSLKGYERRLTERRTNLQKVADLARQLQAHADQQAQQAQSLLERAQGVKGGDKLTGTLARLHETAKAQAAEAAEVHKRAVRSADACAATLANVATRYDGMYQAVVDSPETVPAELAYYQGA